MPRKKRKIVEVDPSPEDKKSASTPDSALKRACEEADDPNTAISILNEQYARCKSDKTRHGFARRVVKKPRSYIVALWGIAYDTLCKPLRDIIHAWLPWIINGDGWRRERDFAIQEFLIGDDDPEWNRIVACDRLSSRNGPFQRIVDCVGSPFVTKLKRALVVSIATTISRSCDVIPDVARIVAGFCDPMECSDSDVYQVLLSNDFDIQQEYVSWARWVRMCKQNV